MLATVLINAMIWAVKFIAVLLTVGVIGGAAAWIRFERWYRAEDAKDRRQSHLRSVRP